MMTIKTNVTFSKNTTIITTTDNALTISIKQTKSIPKKMANTSLFFLYADKQLIFIGKEKALTALKFPIFTDLIEVSTEQDIELDYIERLFVNHALEAGIELISGSELIIPQNILNQLDDLKEQTLLIFKNMNYSFEKIENKKSKPAKARHKWTKEVSEKELYIDTRESKACVMWIKRNQMLIKKGATMMEKAPLNKDGSVGFSAKMGDKIRTDHQEQFDNFVTTEDIILKSVNEVGLFLYFAGTNSWLEMLDTEGKTLNEWTVVE